MAVPSVMADLSVTASSNSPQGSESPSAGDDFIRAYGAIIRSTNAKGSDIASASSIDLGAATGEFVDVTGTTTITSLGTVSAGIVRTVRFTGALTLTHNATSLILPGGASITTKSGDFAMFRSLGSGNWVCVFYADKNGAPVGPFVDINPIVAGSSDATKKARLEVDGLTTATTRVLTVQDRDITIAAATDIGQSTRNLIITNNSSTPNSQVDIDADEIVLKNSSGIPYLASGVNLTVDITASGANGLDTGSEASSTWYYLWVIYNGTTVAGLISASSTAPTLPTGYTYKALVGAVYNDSSSNFVAFHQIGRRTFTGPQTAVNSGSATTYTSVSLATMVPPIAKSASGRMRLISGSTTSHRVDVAANASDLGVCSTGGAIPTGSGSIYAQWNTPLVTAQTIYYRVTNGSAVVEVCEWEI